MPASACEGVKGRLLSLRIRVPERSEVLRSVDCLCIDDMRRATIGGEGRVVREVRLLGGEEGVLRAGFDFFERLTFRDELGLFGRGVVDRGVTGSVHLDAHCLSAVDHDLRRLLEGRPVWV